MSKKHSKLDKLNIAPIEIDECEKNGCIIGKRYAEINAFYRNKGTLEVKGIENAYFTNQIISREKEKSFSNLKINHSIFKNMGLKEIEFHDVDFKHNIFIDCYFRKSKFCDVNFTGCRFINCNFDEIILCACNFEYVTFENCFIKYDILKSNLTDKENLRWRICKNLYIEAKNKGYFDDYRKYFFEEKKASCEHERKIAFYKSQYDKKYGINYYEKYSTWDRISSFGKYLRYKIEKFIWGYGESISRLIITSLIMIIIFTILLSIKRIDIISAFKISALNFIGLSFNEILGSFQSTIGGVIERIIGMIYIGLFITALYKYINRG